MQYADPREPFTRKCAFDVGDYGLGYCSSSLALGCDCLGAIRYFDGVWANAKGEAVTVPKVRVGSSSDAGLRLRAACCCFRVGSSDAGVHLLLLGAVAYLTTCSGGGGGGGAQQSMFSF